MTEPEHRDMLGAADVAKLTRLSVSHVRHLLLAGTELHGTKINLRTWLVERAEVERFLAERKKRRAR